MVIPSNLLLIQNIIKETESEGIYSCNWRGYSASLQGKWVLSNDTLTLYPELYVEISDERGEFKYWPINKEKKSLDSEVCKFKVRNDTLYDITDYTEFHRFTSKEFGIGADYKYNPDEKIPCYIMLHYKPLKNRR